MTQAKSALRLQASLKAEAERLAKAEGTTLNQFSNVAVAERIDLTSPVLKAWMMPWLRLLRSGLTEKPQFSSHKLRGRAETTPHPVHGSSGNHRTA